MTIILKNNLKISGQVIINHPVSTYPAPVTIRASNHYFRCDTLPPVNLMNGSQALSIGYGINNPPVLGSGSGFDGSYIDFTGCAQTDFGQGWAWRNNGSDAIAAGTNITLSLWCRLPSVGSAGYTGSEYIATQEYADTSFYRGIFLKDGKIKFVAREMDGTGILYEHPVVIYDEWVNVIYQQVGSNADCWINGVKVASLTLTQSTSFSWSNEVDFGARIQHAPIPDRVHNQYHGYMDEVRVWVDDALTDEECVGLYTNFLQEIE